MDRKSIASLVACTVFIGGCSAAPPSSREVGHDPILARAEGVVVLVDVCLQRDGLGGAGDYFVVEESQHGAMRVQDKLRQYLDDSNIHVRAQATLICGAQHGDKESILTSDRIGGDASMRSQPLLFTSSNTADDEGYELALQIISAYAFERAAAGDAAKPGAVSQLEFLDAADVVQNRTGAASIFFLGALGSSRSGAANVVSAIGRVIVGTATGVATAGLGGDYYVMFLPGGKASGRLMEAALIDLESGQLTWSNAVNVGGNPAHEKNWENDQPIELLIHDILFQPSSTN